MAGTLGIDPTKDIAGVLGSECFMCGHEIVGAEPLFFGKPGDFGVRLPAHGSCLEGRPLQVIVREFQRRVQQMAGVKATH